MSNLAKLGKSNNKHPVESKHNETSVPPNHLISVVFADKRVELIYEVSDAIMASKITLKDEEI